MRENAPKKGIHGFDGFMILTKTGLKMRMLLQEASLSRSMSRSAGPNLPLQEVEAVLLNFPSGRTP